MIWSCVVMMGLVGLLLGFGVAVIYGFVRDPRPEVVILILIVSSLICGSVGTLAQPGYETYQIYSIGDSSSLHGTFFLGSGSINSEPAFFYYKGVGLGKVLDSAPASRSIVYEDTDTPYIKVSYCSCQSNSETYEIHVPKDTIIKQFKLDGV